MSKYSLFKDTISDDVKEIYEEEYAQTAALIDAANLIGEAMEERGVNQTELARLLGVSSGYVSRLLSGNENISIKNLARVLHVLGKRYKQSIVSIKIHEVRDNVHYFQDYSDKFTNIDEDKITISTEAVSTKWVEAI